MGSGLVCAILLLGLAATGCDEGEYDGAVWRYIWATEGDQTILVGGAQCIPIAKGTDTGASEGKPSWGFFAIHDKSAGGKIEQAVYIKPEGAPADFEVTVENGELAHELVLKRSSFEDQELVEVEVETHEGEVVHLAHWFEEECGEATPPESFEQQ